MLGQAEIDATVSSSAAGIDQPVLEPHNAAPLLEMYGGAPNQIALWTYAVLWVARISAQLNLFLGVRNAGEQFLSERLRYLASYFRHRPMNALFPVSVATGVAALVWMVAQSAANPDAVSPGFTMVIALIALATLEHLLLMLPLDSTTLWGAALRERATDNLRSLRP